MEINQSNLIKAISKQIAEQSTLILTNREREFKVSFDIKGEAVIKKGQDYEQIFNWSIDWQKAFMFACNKVNERTAAAVLREFLTEPEIEITSEFKERVILITKEIKGTATKLATGKVTINSEFLHSQMIDICENC